MAMMTSNYPELLEDLDAIVWEADPDTLQFTFVSRRAEDLLGYPVQAWLTNPGFWTDIIHPDDREQALATCVEAIRRGEDHRFEYRVLTSDQRTVWIKDTVRVVCEPGRGCVRLCGVMVDVTGQRSAEFALQDRETYHRALIDHASDIITVIDCDGIVLFESPSVERVLGHSPDAFVGRHVFERIHPDDRTRAASALERGWETPGSWPMFELRFHHADGSWRVLEVVGSAFTPEGGQPIGIINSRDITDRRLIEDHFRHAQKMDALGRVTSAVAHDFNNLLVVILGYAELLLNSPDAAPFRLETREIKKAADLGVSLTRQLLTFSRRTSLALKPVDLNRTVAELASMLQRLIGMNIRLGTVLQARPAIVQADQGLIEQVIMNLALNARDAMPGGGSLDIRTRNVRLPRALGEESGRADAAFVLIEVADTGAGMSAEVAARVFEPFFTTKAPGKGTGLGLATVYSIVAESHGYIDVHTLIGEGTTFNVYLPLMQAEPSPF
jgi:two-component system cell cycle sensor histidine kinase/response regulator CckA